MAGSSDREDSAQSRSRSRSTQTPSSNSPSSTSTAGASKSENHTGKGGLGKRSKAGGLAVVALVALYSFSAPRLNDRYGWSLPAIKTDRDGNVQLAPTKSQNTAAKPSQSQSDQSENSRSKPTEPNSSVESVASGNGSSPPSSSTTVSAKPSAKSSAKPGPLADKMRSSDRSSPLETDDLKASTNELLYGILHEISRDRYVSPAGLMYVPGSAEGHRLEHLRRHTEDDPGRPGSHGVFDGEMPGALATIDRAYERAKKNQKTSKSEEDGRTIYTVDMGGRVGFIGGRSGKQKRNPMARRVRLVLDGNRVITAYPM